MPSPRTSVRRLYTKGVSHDAQVCDCIFLWSSNSNDLRCSDGCSGKWLGDARFCRNQRPVWPCYLCRASTKARKTFGAPFRGTTTAQTSCPQRCGSSSIGSRATSHFSLGLSGCEAQDGPKSDYRCGSECPPGIRATIQSSRSVAHIECGGVDSNRRNDAHAIFLTRNTLE